MALGFKGLFCFFFVFGVFMTNRYKECYNRRATNCILWKYFYKIRIIHSLNILIKWFSVN